MLLRNLGVGNSLGLGGNESSLVTLAALENRLRNTGLLLDGGGGLRGGLRGSGGGRRGSLGSSSSSGLGLATKDCLESILQWYRECKCISTRVNHE